MRCAVILILFLSIVITGSAQKNDSVLCLPKTDVITLANKIKVLQDTILWQKRYIYWQDTLIAYQDTLIKSQKYRISICELQVDNLRNIINASDAENKRLRESVELLMPKWYNDKWFWFGNGVLATTIFVFLIK